MALSNLLSVTDWSLTSLGGSSISVPIKALGILGLGVASVPMEFTHKKTGQTCRYVGQGVSGSVAALPSAFKWLRGKFSASFSPSTFPSHGELVALQLARDPFYIDQIRGNFGVSVAAGVDVGFTAALGCILFTYIPPAGVAVLFGEIMAIAVCFYRTTGEAIGGWGPTAEQTVFMIS